MTRRRPPKTARRLSRKSAVRRGPAAKTRSRGPASRGLLVKVARTIGSTLGSVSALADEAAKHAKAAGKSKLKDARAAAKGLEHQIERQAKAVRKKVVKLAPI